MAVLALMFQSSIPSTTSNQIVNYTLSGDAVNGVDYQLLYPASQNTLYLQTAPGIFNPFPNALTGVKGNSGTIVIQADSAQATLFIKPLNNALATGTKNLTLTLSQSGNYNVGLNYAFSLNIKSPSTHIEYVTACTSYYWHNKTYTASVIDTFKTTTSPTSGIDSLAILNLTIKQPTSSILNVTTLSSSYTWNGTTYTNSGSYIVNGLKNAVGCDSTATLNLTIGNAATSIKVSGNIVTPLNETINNATMTVNGGDSTVVIQNGYSYSINLPISGNYSLGLYKNNDANPMSGISIADYGILQAHIIHKASDRLLTSPYLMIAADVNKDGAVSIADLAFVKKMILGELTTFPSKSHGNNLWSFVDSSYRFADTANPFPYPDTIGFKNLTANQINKTFYAMKLGELSVGANVNILGVSGAHQPVGLFYKDTKVDGDGNVHVPIKVKDFNSIMGMQFTLNFDSELLQLKSIEGKAVTMDYSTRHANNGKVSFMWADNKVEPQTLADSTELMELVFEKKGDFEHTALSISSEVTPISACDGDFGKHGIVMNAGKISIPPPVIPTQSWTIAPNPTTGMVNLTLSLTQGKDVEFELLSAEGKKLMQQRMSVNRGKSTSILNLGKDTKLSPGIYYLKATGIDALGMKKVIIR